MRRYALIAEPDPQRAAGLLSLMTEEGLEGVVAKDGAEAQDVVRQRGAPLLLVTDLALPRLDGFALLTWLREQEDSAATQVVVVTAFDELRVRAWQLKEALGIHALLSRRASSEVMRDTLHRVLAGQLAPQPPPAEGAAEQERQRLASIAAMHLVDNGPPEAELQQLVKEVAQAFGVPVALLTLVLGERQWFKAHVGLPPPSRRTGARRATGRSVTTWCRGASRSSYRTPGAIPTSVTTRWCATASWAATRAHRCGRPRGSPGLAVRHRLAPARPGSRGRPRCGSSRTVSRRTWNNGPG
ncbi:response regulator [Myxococcus sp. MxC21-1]|nr:response regulator [Myxococcus sp. MxC21-1]WNZ58952.1 response regulator [Myxococcus sp. MxC21-1]